jgi:hypothetical protein
LRKGGHYDIRIKTMKTQTGQNTDHPPRFLRACRRHPRCRAAQKADELAPSHGPSLTPRTTTYHIVEKSGVVHHTKLGRSCRFRVIRMRSARFSGRMSVAPRKRQSATKMRPVVKGQIRTSRHNARLDEFEEPRRQVATTAMAVGACSGRQPRSCGAQEPSGAPGL